jgi:hypothetical protein
MKGVGVCRSVTPPIALSSMALSIKDSSVYQRTIPHRLATIGYQKWQEEPGV